MKYGILGDIHANLSALETALSHLDAAGCEVLVSVGDVVGYGAAPSACIAHLRERDVHVVMGNHDAACAELLDDRYFNPYAREAVAWTRNALDRDELRWLAQRPLVVTLEHCQVAHGTIHEPEAFHYLMEMHDALPSLRILERPVGFVGHTHVPLSVFQFPDGQYGYTIDADVDLTEIERAVVNVGSVGQPRDENPHTAFAVFDSESRQVQVCRAAYDVDSEVRRILDAGLPQVLANRLKLGV